MRQEFLSVSPQILSNAMRGRIGLEPRKISRAKSTASERKLRAVVCAVLSAGKTHPLRTAALYKRRISERARRS